MFDRFMGWKVSLLVAESDRVSQLACLMPARMFVVSEIFGEFSLVAESVSQLGGLVGQHVLLHLTHHQQPVQHLLHVEPGQDCKYWIKQESICDKDC